MLNFNEEQLLREHQNGVDIIPQVQSIVDKICLEGYNNIFYIGIGGTNFYAKQMYNIVKQEGSTIPVYVENAADFTVIGNPFFSKDSVVFIESISGDTKEVVAAVDFAHAKGAKVVGYIEKKESPLAKKVDYLVTTVGGAYYYWYTVTLRFMRNAGQFDKYDEFINEIRNLPKSCVEISKIADYQANEYAKTYCDEPITYLVGSGNLEDWAYCYGMCIMEEMQWMKTRAISASDFFHGTLEVIERDVPVMLIKGEDKTRPLMERVERFVNKISAKVFVFDSMSYPLVGISDEFRPLLCPIIMRTAFQRLNVYLEYYRRHPLAIRRYYRHLDY